MPVKCGRAAAQKLVRSSEEARRVFLRLPLLLTLVPILMITMTISIVIMGIAGWDLLILWYPPLLVASCQLLQLRREAAAPAEGRGLCWLRSSRRRGHRLLKLLLPLLGNLRELGSPRCLKAVLCVLPSCRTPTLQDLVRLVGLHEHITRSVNAPLERTQSQLLLVALLFVNFPL